MIIKRVAGFFMVLISAGFLIHFYNEHFNSWPSFKTGEKVRITRGSEHALALHDGQKPWLPAEGWWRLTVAKDEGDGWVKVQTHDPALIRYARASKLSPGWMTSDQYEEKYHEAELRAEAKREAELASIIHLPTNSQIKHDEDSQ